MVLFIDLITFFIEISNISIYPCICVYVQKWNDYNFREFNVDGMTVEGERDRERYFILFKALCYKLIEYLNI